MRKYPNYDDCLVNLANSVLHAFGVEAGPGLPELRAQLEKSKNVVIFLLDGMGTAILQRHLAPEGFFRRHFARSFSSVFPPTTVAATTSIQSGQQPVEHSWLGWDCYYPALGQNVTVFTNKLQLTDTPAADYPVAATLCPYESLVEKINKAGQQAYAASPFCEPFPGTLEEICHRIQTLCQLPGRKFIYSYWPEPDSTIHATGVGSPETKAVLEALEAKMEALCNGLSDTLVIFTADHGLTDAKGAVLTDYPEITACLERMPSIEPRALNFFVKAGMEQTFCRAFEERFGDKFLLLSHQQVVDLQLFGTGTPHPAFHEMLGDYLAVAVSDLAIYCTAEEAGHYIGTHAGLTEDEITIPLILYPGGPAHE